MTGQTYDRTNNCYRTNLRQEKPMTGQTYDRTNLWQDKLMTGQTYERTNLWLDKFMTDKIMTGQTYNGKNIEQEKVKQRIKHGTGKTKEGEKYKNGPGKKIFGRRKTIGLKNRTDNNNNKLYFSLWP